MDRACIDWLLSLHFFATDQSYIQPDIGRMIILAENRRAPTSP